jgi:autotransporter-associated beta strand protein
MLVLSGTSTYTGPTTVNGGFLAVNGSILSSITVNSGSTLKGSGTINAPIIVTSGAVISPGNSIGILTGSSVSFGPSSIFDVEINLSGSGSQLILTGTAGIDPSAIVQVRQDPGVYPPEMSYDILSAVGGITGSFDPTVTVIGGQPGYNFSLLQTLNLIKLQYSYLPPPPSGISLIGLQGNRAKLATYLNEYASTNTLEYFTDLSGRALDNALTSVSPSRNAVPISVTQQTAFTLNGIVSSHLDTFRVAGRNFSKKTSSKKTAHDKEGDSSGIFTEIGKMFDLLVDASGQVLPTPYTKEVSLHKGNDFCGWISGLAQYAHQKAEQQNPSYNFLSEVLTTGFDYRGIEKTLLGGGLGYAHTHYSEGGNVGHGNINYYFSTVYANAYIDQFYLSPALLAVYNQVHNTRNISFTGFSGKAKASINSWQFTPHLEVGYDIQEDKWGNITPFTSLDWVINWQAAYNEEGASPFTARQGGRRASIARSETGFKFSQAWRYSWGALLLKEKGSYIFEKPFATSNLHTGFVGLPSALALVTGTSPLNLGSIGFDLQASVGQKKPISIKMGFEGEMGVRYLSGEANLMLSKDF